MVTESGHPWECLQGAEIWKWSLYKHPTLDFMLHPRVDNFQFLAFFFFKLTFKSLLLVRPSTQETKAKCLGLKDKIQLSTF